MRDPEIRDLRDLIREIAASGVTLDDTRLRYVEVQIDRVTWDHVRALVEEWSEGEQDGRE